MSDGLNSQLDDDLTEVALSVISLGKKLGAAYYNFDTEHLYLLPDCASNSPLYSSLDILIRQIQPHYVITTCESDEKFLCILKDAFSRNSFVANNSSETTHVILLPNIDFAYASSRYHLENLSLMNMPQNMNSTEKKIYFSSLIDFTSSCMVKAAGGLLKFIGKKTLHHEKNQSFVAVSKFSLKNVVNIDENTYRALQIFQDEKHPSVYKNVSCIKEGLSLYGICNKCKSSIGRKELRCWFLLPSRELNLITKRHSAVLFFSLASNSEISSTIQNSLKHIKYLPKVFSRMKTGEASMNDWKTLYKTSYHAMIIVEICHTHSSSLPIFKEISATCTTTMFRIASLLDKVIDFEEYARQNHFSVKPGLDFEIDKMKQIYNGLPDFMTQIAHQELDLHTDIDQCRIIYLPQLGYLLAIPMTECMKETKDYSLPNLKFMFILNNTVYYRSINTRKLDALLGDTLYDIYDKETYILHKLQDIILQTKDVYFRMLELMSELDCLIALAVAANEFNWTKPDIKSNGEFYVTKARHPLQELCVDAFVDNDILSGRCQNKIKILTGPNSSGKSTYLKQVALIAFLAHIGSFVPAQNASLPLLDALLSCISIPETVSVNLSSFLMTANQLSSCLSYSSSNSLVIVDEFGKDTETCSGMSLLIAAINFLLLKGSSVPHVFIATHYLSVSLFLPSSPSISFQTIDMIFNDDLIFFYQLIDGVATSSHASHIALQAGLSEKIVKRCNSIMKDATQNIIIQETRFSSKLLRRYKNILKEFLKLNPETSDVVDFIKHILEELPNDA